MAGSINS